MIFLAVLCLAILGGYLWWNRSALHLSAAQKAFQRGDEEACLEAFGRAEAAGRLGADPTASYVYLLLKNGRTDEAGVLVRHALARGRRGRALKEADRRLLTTYLSLVVWKEGDVPAAVSLLEGLRAEGYRTTALYGNLGYLLQLVGDGARAEALCLEAAEWAPDGKVILDNLGALYLGRGEWDKAGEVYDRLLPLDPKFPEAWWGAGRVSLHRGQSAEARARFEKALSLPFNALTTLERSTVEAGLADLK